jgi:hypothetical protein
MQEKPDSTLLYIDMMGFATLTENNPDRLEIWESADHRYYGSSSSKSSNQFMAFQSVLESAIFHNSLRGSIKAMLFSDCAFLEFVNSLLCTMATRELMRDFLLKGVPVRMGIGRGTFHLLKFSTDFSDSIVNRSLFFGTAVVRAHAAERCTESGFRIFLHPSVEPELGVIRQSLRVLDVANCEKAKWEIDFLYEPRPAHEEPSPDAKDKELFTAVAKMNDSTVPLNAQRHYAATLSALNRMRIANARATVEI